MKIGAVIYCSDQGLGYLAKDYYDNGIIDKVLIVPHSRRKNHFEWYKNEGICSSVEELLDKVDIVLAFETFFNHWDVIPKAIERGKKTILIPMYECTPNPLPYYPDVIVSPSLLDQQYYPNSTFIGVPAVGKWRLREKANVFVHNAGNGGLGGRNGTRELIEAMKYVKSPIKLIIRTQEPNFTTNDSRIEIRRGNFERETLYEEGDVFIFPEKFNGQSKPLQEAYASGMLIMCAARFPMNTWLPKEPLIPVSGYRKEKICVEFDSAVIRPEDIAQTIDKWYGRSISKLSKKGRTWAERSNWKGLKDKLIGLCK